MDLLRRFWRVYCAKHTRSYLLGFAALAATTLLTVAIPRFVELAVDAMESLRPGAAVGWAWAIIAAGVGVMGVRTLSRILFFNPGREIEYALKGDLFAHLTRLPRRYFDELRPGDLISRGTNDASAVRAFVGFSTLQGFNVALTLLFTVGQMALTNGLLTLLCLGPLLLAVLVMRLAVRRLFGLVVRAQRQVATLSERTLEAYNGAAVLQSFNAVPGAEARFDAANEELLDIGMGLVAVQSWLLPVVTVIGNACLVVVLYAGGSMVVDGGLSKGELAAFAVYIRIVVGGLRMFGFVLSSLQRGWVSLRRIFAVLDASDSSLDATSGGAPLPAHGGPGRGLSVRGLSFTHAGAAAPALRDISFEVARGEVVGIFGLTGSGKTTLLDVIARTYEPPPGTVAIDGVDVRALSLPAYREVLAYVPQDAFLFSQSIRDNIALAAPLGQRDDARVVTAASEAALTADLGALPEGLDTPVGQRGITLSGGQRQRTALARAFYRPFEVLLLDDVLSAVDHATERQLIDAIYARAGGATATTLIVSHRISVLERAQRVLVLDGGRLVAVGSHAELLARGVEPYRRIHALQRARERAEVRDGEGTGGC